MSKDIKFASPLPALKKIGSRLAPYGGVALFLVLAVIYAFIVVRINSLSNPTVDESEVQTQVKSAPAPRIDAEAAKRLQELKDNSVNVQTFFEQGRTNPFDE